MGKKTWQENNNMQVLFVCLFIQSFILYLIAYTTGYIITKLPNSEQSYKGKVKTHKCINRQNQSITGKLWKP
jgi:hypothetical protein